MNDFTIRSKIQVWFVALCVVALLGAALAANIQLNNGAQSQVNSPSAIAAGHAGSNGGGG